MTNKIAIWLGLILIAAIVADIVLVGGADLIFLGKKLFELLNWMAFWR